MTLEEHIRSLQDQLTKTLVELAASRKREAERQAENEALRKDNEALRKDLEKWKRGFSERKKRRSSRPESQRKRSGKGPGRPSGHPGAKRNVPDHIHLSVEHLPPTVCACGGEIELTGQSQSTIVQDIPKIEVQNIRHLAPEGKCMSCGKKHQARLPGQPPVGTSIAQVQLGPNLLALTLDLRFEQHVPLAKISGFLDTWFSVEVTPSGLYQLTLFRPDSF